MKTWTLLLALVLAIIAGCGGSSGNGSEAPPAPTVTTASTAIDPATPTAPATVGPVVFPDDEAPHQNTTEWWYYTGHLFDSDGNRYGFEFVFFQVRQPNLPAYYASHFAITDNAAGAFNYDQKSGFNATVDAQTGFHFLLDDWEMSGANGTDQLRASLDDYTIDLTLTDAGDPVLHNKGTGYMDIAAAGGSYYYSRPQMEVSGSLRVDERTLEVGGTAWMDHQWGDFVLIDGGGWDWFAVQLDDGTALMVFELRGAEAAGDIPDFGTLVQADGTVVHLTEDDYAIEATDEWTSEASGATYPVGWTISIPGQKLDLRVDASMPVQELDTTDTTGTIYWEGEVVVEGTRGDDPVAGLGYVELTGYAGDDIIAP